MFLFLSCCHFGRGGLVKVVMGEFGTLFPCVSCGVYGENGMPVVSKAGVKRGEYEIYIAEVFVRMDFVVLYVF